MPPAGSAPVVLFIAPCFEAQGNQSVVEAQSYIYYIQLKASQPSQGIWVPYDDKAERTIEVNPFSGSRQKLETLRSLGFNRLSVGVQSLSDPLLRTLGRPHSGRQALETLEAARERALRYQSETGKGRLMGVSYPHL